MKGRGAQAAGKDESPFHAAAKFTLPGIYNNFLHSNYRLPQKFAGSHWVGYGKAAFL